MKKLYTILLVMLSISLQAQTESVSIKIRAYAFSKRITFLDERTSTVSVEVNKYPENESEFFNAVEQVFDNINLSDTLMLAYLSGISMHSNEAYRLGVKECSECHFTLSSEGFYKCKFVCFLAKTNYFLKHKTFCNQ